MLPSCCHTHHSPIDKAIAQNYGKAYAPNTRETIRRQTVHQFVEAGILIVNPDKPSRPPNSPRTVYQIEQSTLELIRTYKTDDFCSFERTIAIAQDFASSLSNGSLNESVVEAALREPQALAQISDNGEVEAYPLFQQGIQRRGKRTGKSGSYLSEFRRLC